MSHPHIPEAAWEDAANILRAHAKVIAPLDPYDAENLRNIAHYLEHGTYPKKRRAA